MNSERIASMNREDLARLVKFLYEEKKLDKEIDAYIGWKPPVKVQLSVMWLHTNLCTESHPPCRFYDEEEVADSWLGYDHEVWMRTYESIRTSCKLTDDEFTSCIDTVQYLQGEVARRKNWKPDPGPFLEKLFAYNNSVLSPIPQRALGPALPAESLGECEVTEAEIEKLLETGPQAQ